ncbi:DeoR/GlpR family DNA-binding transcription regulator [Photobacterium nomapromontoriensis]|uniref:DeoR/GlpR family DNA-binding transcription regulator n=1 Tax=Photobacterium nomapromontoriensis TaxID=2910237 RepID=UPI003D0C7530
MNIRKQQIITEIDVTGSALVINLSEKYNVSVETIRRDLKDLEKKGKLVRVHGGAISCNVDDMGTSFNNRAKYNVDNKRTLVEKIVSEMFEGAIIGIDASSSSWLFAQVLPNIPCTVVTNSINVVETLSKKNNIKVICLGGEYSTKYEGFYGMITKSALLKLSLDFCVISCSGFDFDKGVWDSNEINLDVKRTLLDVSDHAIVIADETKYKKRSLLKICEIHEIDYLVTNISIDNETKADLEKKYNLVLINQ